MASVWERFGEHLGYGLAALILGPAAALERRTRRAMRAAMLDFASDLRPMKLEARRGVVRRTVQLSGIGEITTMELELNLARHAVTITLPLARLPRYAEARIRKAARALGREFALEFESLATAGAFQLESDRLDSDAAQALVSAIASGPLGSLDAVNIVLSPESLVSTVPAPTKLEGWHAIRDGIVGLALWIAQRWPASYR